MPHSFTLNPNAFATPTGSPGTAAATAAAGGKRTVLVTGAAGTIGSSFAEHGAARYDLRLMVRPTSKPEKTDRLAKFGQLVRAELADPAALKAAFAGVDTVVHLAADPDPNATWASLLPDNIVGTYNTMVAAKAAGVRRVVYASSIHAVGGYGPAVQVKTSEPPNPGDLYGVTKCFGEALGRYMAEQEGLSVIAIRIGAFQPPEAVAKPRALGFVDCWISPRDMNQLFDRCIAADHLRWAVFHGLSGNAFNHLDLSDAKALLGYEPQDDAAATLPELAPMNLKQGLMTHSMEDAWAKSGVREDV
ncbi:MAG: UDP-glucose 4-epimerase [uncultured Phycisphaerae bacterium]|uniref:UDP-glucose 4-epimerase n=1 Tax=uncultured Phycisphaerae bacterium TaxID=904963 RepID=A0A6J4NFA2_9BACT|nr:MAG: UDP-glucose 4-epimerase [uncultured Phycisphaerae bacterium]